MKSLQTKHKFIRGFGNILDISASNPSSTYLKIKSRSDSAAIFEDWKVTGQAISESIKKIQNNQSPKNYDKK